MSLVPAASAEVVDDARISELADSIRSKHDEFVRRGRDLIRLAIEIGEEILEARRLVPRGEWVAWLEDHVRVSVPTAYAYEHLAAGRAQVERAWADGQSIETLRAALQLVRPGTAYGAGRKYDRVVEPRSQTLPPVVVTDEMIARAAGWFTRRFPKTFAKMPPQKARQRARHWARGVLYAALDLD